MFGKKVSDAKSKVPRRSWSCKHGHHTFRKDPMKVDGIEYHLVACTKCDEVRAKVGEKEFISVNPAHLTSVQLLELRHS